MSDPSEHEYKGPERRRLPHLTDEQIDAIADRGPTNSTLITHHA